MFDSFIGQPNNKFTIETHINACKPIKQAIPNILLDWPPGTGKTTFAAVIADAMNAPFHSVDMTTIGGKDSLFDQIYKFTGGVLLLDELHALPGRVKESLLPLVYRGHVMRGGRLVRTIPYLTVIGATTEISELKSSLISRFPIQLDAEPYSDDDITQILKGFLDQRGTKLSNETVSQLTLAAGGNPRSAESLALHASVAGKNAQAGDICRIAQMEWDGLRSIHIRYLQILWDNKLELNPTALASALGVSYKRLPLIEELLRSRGYIANTSGYRRELTESGMARIVGEQAVWTPS